MEGKHVQVLILGAGFAGLTAGIYAARAGTEVLILEHGLPGGQAALTWKIDNYPGMPGVSGRELLRVFRTQAENAGAQVISALARQLQPMGEGYMALCGNDVIEARAIVLAMGAARPKLLPGEEELLGQWVSWCGTCDGMFYRGKEVAVLSAWQGGVEEADFLSRLAAKVDYYRLAPHDVPDRLTIIPSTPKALARQEGRIAVTTAEGSRLYDGVFVFRPAVAPDRLLPGLKTEGAFIAVNRRMQTSLPRVYAAGDCTGQPLQIAKAVGEGNIAAISAAEDLV